MSNVQMKIDIMTLFPDTVDAVMHSSIMGRAMQRGLIDIQSTNIRDYSPTRNRRTDDYPYGGGKGLVMLAEPLYLCHEHLCAGEHVHTILMSPQGKTFNQEKARELLEKKHIILVCGHYEGIDERFIEECVDEELSIGDFVLTGGELAAMVVTDAVCRMVPGVLSDEACYTGESHWDGLLEYPQYTRPDVWQGREVPEVLRSGDHAKVERWRRKKQLERTMDKRPDMFAELTLTDKTDLELLEEIRRDRSRMVLTELVTYRRATSADLPAILDQAVKARSRMKKQKINFGKYHDEETFRRDVQEGNCFVICYGNMFAGMFTVEAAEKPFCPSITDGKWKHEGKHVVLRRLAVDARYSGTGMANTVMGFVESIACEMGAEAIRVPVHKKNVAMKKLLSKHDYRYRGNINLTLTSEGLDLRQGFEKVLV